MKKILKENNKGITLIALVITIIVLLILAGITISILIDNDGIIQKMQQAKVANNEAIEKEMQALKLQEEMIAVNTRISTAERWSGSIGEKIEKGEGTEEFPYEISNGEELAYLAKMVNEGNTFEGKKFIIINDIDLQNKDWMPIGGIGDIVGGSTVTSDALGKAFKGEIDGNNKIIYGISVNIIDKGEVGLIGYLASGGKVKDLIIGSGTVVGSALVGGIAGANQGIIESCTNYAEVKVVVNSENLDKSERDAGGIAGYADSNSKIINCVNRGKISTTRNFVGGIVGRLRGNTAIVENCTNEGEIISGRDYSGGIIGYASGKTEILNCINLGEITSTQRQAGGICGRAEGDNITVKKCTNKGKITANIREAGGIVAFIVGRNATIMECVNEGEVLASTLGAGGISSFIGSSVTAIVQDCVNNGAVTVKDQQAGGIVSSIGESAIVTIKNCENNGEVLAYDICSGGISGYINGGNTTILDCINNGIITANTQQVGGIVGSLNCDNAKIISSINVGDVVCKSMNGRGIAGGIVGIQRSGEIEKSYNTGKIMNNNYNDSSLEASGGIVGALLTGKVKYCYGFAQFEGGDLHGGVIGQWNTSNTATVEKNYYGNENIRGIGSKGNIDTTITVQEDEIGITGKIENLKSFEEFKVWIKNKHPEVVF